MDEGWFTEIAADAGTAFSLRLTGKGRLHEEQSPYQRIEVYDTATFGRLMTIDGFVMLTDRDNFIYHEMMSHPALYTHPDPRRVLIIGGGDCGTLREVLKHPEVREAQQVEIDERVTRVAEQYFPQLCEANHDPRAQFHFTDGIRFLKDSDPGYFDVIIVDSTDPIGPAEGLFSETFYRDCLRALNSRGLLVAQSESPLLHTELLKAMHGAIRGAGFLDVLTLHFPQPVYPSGWWSATMACKDMPLSGFREDDARDKPFETRYYNAGIHGASMAVPEFFYQALMS
ncbi:MAG TPA: polyamine aminopropyltransferase [Gammaproteobacteria bacterium]|nr:polyamine aminopropyltransferase [Gammaproteobacteria bacterium]